MPVVRCDAAYCRTSAMPLPLVGLLLEPRNGGCVYWSTHKPRYAPCLVLAWSFWCAVAAGAPGPSTVPSSLKHSKNEGKRVTDEHYDLKFQHRHISERKECSKCVRFVACPLFLFRPNRKLLVDFQSNSQRELSMELLL